MGFQFRKLGDFFSIFLIGGKKKQTIFLGSSGGKWTQKKGVPKAWIFGGRDYMDKISLGLGQIFPFGIFFPPPKKQLIY